MKRAGEKFIRPREEHARATLSLRVAPKLKATLEEEAVKRGRSLSQEVEYRLERSVERVELLDDVLTLAYGEQIKEEVVSHANLLQGIRASQRLIEQGWVAEKFLRPHINQSCQALLAFYASKADHVKGLIKKELIK
jgi:hypothetical protein